jgi:hypothetical protein
MPRKQRSKCGGSFPPNPYKGNRRGWPCFVKTGFHDGFGIAIFER